MNLLSTENFELILAEDLETLVKFDDHGLLIGPGESLKDYAGRLELLNKNISELADELTENGEVELAGFRFNDTDAIPQPIFQSAESRTRDLYDFGINWVPGFFTNKQMGILFAGCAMYSREDSFAVFVIRKAFQWKEMWIIYSRTELMAHELCHIAHIGFDTKNYEEIFAYQSSESRFRRVCGGMLRTSADTYLLLFSVFVLLVAQLVNVAVRPPADWGKFPMPMIFSMTFLTIAFICSRYIFYMNRFRRAVKNLARLFDRRYSLPILFRCSETEIEKISKFHSDATLREWLNLNRQQSARWRVILQKYDTTSGNA